LFLTQFQT